jgi:recombinational DNA repair protein RecT
MMLTMTRLIDDARQNVRRALKRKYAQNEDRCLGFGEIMVKANMLQFSCSMSINSAAINAAELMLHHILQHV